MKWVTAMTAALLAAAASPALAQSQVTPPADGITFLSRSSFHLNAEHLASDEERFVWDTNFGGDLDLIDYGYGRLNFAANYQAILGEQFRAFDPNQGNYILAGALTARARGVEVGGVFFHQSRHLSDRAKRQPVDWNMLGVGIEADRSDGRIHLHGRGDVRKVVQKSFVDYSWEIASDGRLEYALGSRAALLAAGGVRWLGTDGTQNRGTQTGARGEGGVRLNGPGAAVEFFLAVERRIDPYPLEFGTSTWASVGFRLLSR
ncbi:MAG: hypothetical protein ABL986_02035 [Vicinamibacterales bacterium]